MFNDIEALQTLQTREDTKTLPEPATELKRLQLDIGYDQALVFIGTWTRILNGSWILAL
jgi:hypothetical protein